MPIGWLIPATLQRPSLDTTIELLPHSVVVVPSLSKGLAKSTRLMTMFAVSAIKRISPLEVEG